MPFLVSVVLERLRAGEGVPAPVTADVTVSAEGVVAAASGVQRGASGGLGHCQPQTMRANRETNPICHNMHNDKGLTADLGPFPLPSSARRKAAG